MGKCFTVHRQYQSSETWLIEVVDPEWTAEEVFEALQCGEINFYPEKGRIKAGCRLIARADLHSQFFDGEPLWERHHHRTSWLRPSDN